VKRISIKLLTGTGALFALAALAIMVGPAVSFADSHPVVTAFDNADVKAEGWQGEAKAAILPSRVSCAPDILTKARTRLDRSAHARSGSQIVGGAFQHINPGRRSA
jgi:hypothetical protein